MMEVEDHARVCLLPVVVQAVDLADNHLRDIAH